MYWYITGPDVDDFCAMAQNKTAALIAIARHEGDIINIRRDDSGEWIVTVRDGRRRFFLRSWDHMTAQGVEEIFPGTWDMDDWFAPE